VRELLSRYFDSARRVVGRFGGTVEKFSGDALKDDRVGPSFEAAASTFRDIGAPVCSQSPCSSTPNGWRVAAMVRSRPLLEEARPLFEDAGARPWLERLERIAAAPTVPSAT
jgi:class 3 adenylate cyclase